jgi:hypothetical protein
MDRIAESLRAAALQAAEKANPPAPAPVATGSCEVSRIQENAARGAVDRATSELQQARKNYLTCLGPQAEGNAAVESASHDMQRARTDAAQLRYMHEFITKHMERIANSSETMEHLAEIVHKDAHQMESEVQGLKNKIRKSRRIFLDSGPQVSPAIAGMYFTRVPDNQVLIAFIACFGAFLLFSGVIFGLNLEPARSLFRLGSGERWGLVLGGWLIACIVTYIILWIFT